LFKRDRMITDESGLTFAELLVTSFVLVTAIVSSLLFFTNALTASQYSRDVTVATSHADDLFEEMQSRATLANITGTDWSAWLTSRTADRLPSETVTVTYTNAAAVPLEITARVSWTRKVRVYNESFVTRMRK
jgi:Tfp pilus assembly protein PilV